MTKLNHIEIVIKSQLAALKSSTNDENMSIFAFSKSTIDIKIWHRRLVHLEYRNVMINSKKVISMKSIKGSASNELCEPCLASHQQAERSRISRIKVKKFLERINVDIEIDLSTTSRDNKVFVLIKDDA